MLTPPAIQPGDRVRVVAPSGPFDRGRLERGLAVLERYELKIELDPEIFSTHRYLAGPDPRRLAELQAALDDPGVSLIWAARGGYGATRLLPHLRLEGALQAPKVLAGFSDITALHALLNKAGLPTLHAPVVCGLGESSPETLDQLRRVLEGHDPGPLRWAPARTLTPGKAEGPLLGGNLSVLTRLIGTPYLPDLSGAILFLEDVGERPYRLDRMLTHLELAGLHRGLAGVLLGQFTGCEERGAEYGWEEVVAEQIASWGVPAVMGVPSGHGAPNLPLALGAPVSLDADRATLRWAGPVFARQTPPGAT